MFKKTLCLLLLAVLFALPVSAENAESSVQVQFEDGFSLQLPTDWVSFEVTSEMAESGVIYCLGNADASRLLYVQRWSAPFSDLDALRAELESASNVVLRSADSDSPFLMYNLADSDASGCIALFADGVLNLLFTPQSDTDYMLVAATIMESAVLDHQTH